jgi:CubicO group peptidase (beta-lactamase class C family)
VLKSIAVAVTALSALGCAPRKPALPDDLSSIDDFERYVDSIVATGDPPGVSIAVVRDSGLVYARGFGWADRPRERPAAPDTVYQWWSITKVLTATAVLQLVEAGKVELDAPVKQYLEFFEPKNAERYEPATVRQLLSHSACLNDIGMAILGWVHFDPAERTPQLQLAEDKLREHGKIVCKPGSQGRYSNLGYVVLAALIEKVSGQGYEAYVQERIFEPLGMKNSNFVYTVAMREHEAVGSHPKNLMSWFAFKFFVDEKLAIRELVDGRYWFQKLYSDQKGSTGAIGPATELGRFATALLRGGELDGVRILSRESVELMQRPVTRIRKGAPRRGMHFGLAWFREDDEGRVRLSHGGGGMAFRAMLALYPDDNLGLVVLSNSTYLDGEGGARIAKAAADALAN